MLPVFYWRHWSHTHNKLRWPHLGSFSHCTLRTNPEVILKITLGAHKEQKHPEAGWGVCSRYFYVVPSTALPSTPGEAMHRQVQLGNLTTSRGLAFTGKQAAGGFFSTQRSFGHTLRDTAWKKIMADAIWIGRSEGARIFSSIQVLNFEGMLQLGLKAAYRELGSQAHLSLYWQVLPLHSKGMEESHQKMCCAFCSVLWDSMALYSYTEKCLKTLSYYTHFTGSVT